MIKPGDRVTLFSDMRRKATVISLERNKSTTWHVGGTAGSRTRALIKFDDDTEAVFYTNDLMPLHE